MAIVIGLVFMLVCMAFALLHSISLNRVTLLDWTVLSMGGIYGAGWALVALVTQAGKNSFWEKCLLPFEHLYPLHTLCAFILLGAIYTGWLLIGPLRFKFSRRLDGNLQSRNNRLILASWMLLIIAVVMQWLYTRAYGGFIELLDYSASIRSAIFIIENPLSFLRPFGGLAHFSSFLFFGLLLGGCRRWGVKLGFILAFGFSLYVLFSWLGRIGFFVYLATFVLGMLLARRLRPMCLLLGGGFTMIFLLIGAYHVSVWFDFKTAEDLTIFLARELSFPFASFFAQLDSGEHLMRAFRDFMVAPIYLLPSSWWTSWVENVSQVNTTLIMGARKGEAGVTGGIPVDLITLGLMQASIAGIAVVGVLYGAVLHVIQRLLDSVQNPGVRAIFEAYVAIKLAMLAVFYAQPELVVSGNFGLLVSVVLMALILKAPRIRRRAARCQVIPKEKSGGCEAFSLVDSLRRAQ